MAQKIILLLRNAQGFDYGGAERFPVFVADVLKQEGFVPVILSRHKKLREVAESHNLQVIKGWWWSAQKWNGWRITLFPIYICWQLMLFVYYCSVYLHLRPHALHIQSKDDFVAATFAAKLFGIVTIWTDHADLKHIWRNVTVWYKNPIGKLVYLAAHFTDAITSISKSEYDEATKYLPLNSKIRNKLQVIHNGTPDVSYLYPTVTSDDFIFCSTNRLVTDKGIGEMIGAFNRFHAKYKKTQLLLVGNGPEEDKFRKLAADNPAIHFVGYQSDPLSFVAKSNVLLQPTYHEGFSISILEAFMLHKAVIASAVGGNMEQIQDQVTGLLVPVRNTDALFDAMQLLYEDETLRNKIVKNARTIYEKNYVFDKIIKERFIPLYEKAAR